MISRELLCEVLQINNIKMDPIVVSNNIEYLEYGNQETLRDIYSNHKKINIYELAHKCKEWAYENIKTIPSKRYIGNLLDCYSGKHNGTSWEVICTYGNGETESFIADTEPEAIFKACQWILDNKDNK